MDNILNDEPIDDFEEDDISEKFTSDLLFDDGALFPWEMEPPMPSMILPTSLPPKHHNAKQNTRSTIEWVGMTPVEWVESLAKSTVTSEASQKNSVPPPLCIGTTNLSATAETREATETREIECLSPRHQPDTSINSVSFDHHSSSTSPAKECIELHPTVMPKDWDLDVMFQYHYQDPNQQHHSQQLEQMRVMSLTLEHKPNFYQVEPSYATTRDHFVHMMNWLKDSSPDPQMSLSMLYQDCLHKLNALLTLADRLHVESGDPLYIDDIDWEMPDLFDEGPAECEEFKQPRIDLPVYMADWMCENWTNPYPDELTLKKMSLACGSTPTVISNWLINARTRKWRPAIVKAYELQRPAKYLLEDSINIYRGYPLRDLSATMETAEDPIEELQTYDEPMETYTPVSPSLSEYAQYLPENKKVRHA